MDYTYWLEQIKDKLKQNEGSARLGVFDSGIGGLTSLPYLFEGTDTLHGGFEVIYLGDTAHFPYGEKSKELLAFLLLSRITDLLNQNCEVIGIACNTASI